MGGGAGAFSRAVCGGFVHSSSKAVRLPLFGLHPYGRRWTLLAPGTTTTGSKPGTRKLSIHAGSPLLPVLPVRNRYPEGLMRRESGLQIGQGQQDSGLDA